MKYLIHLLVGLLIFSCNSTKDVKVAKEKPVDKPEIKKVVYTLTCWLCDVSLIVVYMKNGH